MQRLILMCKGCSVSKPSSPTSHQPQQSLANTNTIQHWTRTFPQRPPITEVGFIDELMLIVQRYFKQIDTASVGHPEAASVWEEYELKFRLLKDDNIHLDRTLVEAPEVQGKFVSDLVALLRVLGTGINLLPIVDRNSLEADTHRVIEQASQLTFINPERPERWSTNNLSEFLHAKKAEIKSIIDNLHELLPTILNLFQNLEETELCPADEVGRDQGQRLSRSALTPPSSSSSTSPSAEVRSRLHSTLSKSSTKQSSRCTSLPSTMSLVSAKKSTSSTPPSEARQSQSELEDLDTAHTSTSYEKANALDVPAEVDQYSKRRVMDGQPYHVIEKTMDVNIYYQNHKEFLRRSMLIDTGSGVNFILRSLVEELGLVTVPVEPKDLNCFANLQFQVDRVVIPKWQFSQGEITYQDFIFYVVSEIPGGSIVLGNATITNLDIQLIKVGALVAVEDLEDVPAQKKRRAQQRRQERDFIEFQNKKQQKLEAERADSVEQKKATSKASNHTNAGSSTSQRGS